MRPDQAEAHVLLVDDDLELVAMLREFLEAEGFRIDAATDGEDAVSMASSGGYDAVILDVMLPGISGIDVLRSIRRTSTVPIIMLTARGDKIDRVVGLELGADDYVPKPCFPRELVARLRAILRRGPMALAEQEARTRLRLGSLDIDMAARRAMCAGRLLDLTASEFNLLVCLLRSGDKVASKDELTSKALGRPRTSYDRSIDIHVSNLRQKLARVPDGAVAIETIRGIGYRLRILT